MIALDNGPGHSFGHLDLSGPLLAGRKFGSDLFESVTGVGDKSVRGTHDLPMVPVHTWVGGNVEQVNIPGIDPTRIPVHIAAVMDGNGRWATSRGLKRTDGHAAGEEALFDTVEGALDLGVKWLTVYAFSTENWRRPADEVRFLMGFNESLLVRRRDELHERDVRMRFIGRRDWRVPKRLLRRMDESVELTKNNRTLTFTIAFNYGGRAEIVDAVKKLMADGVPADKVDEKAIARRLYDPDMPDPDLVVRTSGEYRTSNFLMWEAAYSELVFTETLWPDFRRENLFDAVREYQARDRRFGGLSPEA
jgi:undecaprenyl diphosphate synthase